MNINRYSRTYVFIALFSLPVFLSYAQIRSYDGYGNNLAHPDWGSAGSALRTLTPYAYGDGISTPTGTDRPNPRTISNELFAQLESIFDGHSLTDYTWVFAQFIDHDLTLVGDSGQEPAFISVPSCDPVFDPSCTGSSLIPMMRSKPVEGTGTDATNPRQFANEISAYLDGSAVYGSDVHRANWLRSFVDGKLKVSEGDLLPFNTMDGELNGATDATAPEMDMVNTVQKRYFVAGDKRANENVMLTAMHTLFVREHNRLCDEIKGKQPGATDEQIYQKARKMLGGFIQNIVYSEWLPNMGVILEDYSGYRPDINPSISNVFSAAAFRFGHTLLSSHLLRMNDECETVPQGDITLRSAFFNPQMVVASGIEPLVKGMSAQVQQMLDCKVIDDVRNFLFGPPGMGFGMDLVSININRGRERGLPDYNSIRSMLGLGRVKTFGEIVGNLEEAKTMEDLYRSVDQVDPWVGMLAEEHMPGAMFGESIMTIMKEQFRALRDGDRFYFEIDPELTAEDKTEIRNTTLAYIIMRNTELQSMQKNVFVMERKCHEIALDERHLAMNVAPNPIRSDFKLHVYSFETGTARLIMTDIMGKEVINMALPLSNGVNSFDLNIGSGTPIGFYNLQIKMNERSNAQKVLKIN
ncbi:MAG: hypothetical protein KDC53_04110 [Saprospiraceae bacterium]|nr:hypothetical protein [Saprospiraceae bacterium]